jgi:uncharacterized protein
VFDGRTGWCIGCGRTREECRAWKKAQPHRLNTISAELPRRLAKLAGNGGTQHREQRDA